MNEADIYKEGWDAYATVNSNASCQLALLARESPTQALFHRTPTAANRQGSDWLPVSVLSSKTKLFVLESLPLQRVTVKEGSPFRANCKAAPQRTVCKSPLGRVICEWGEGR